MSFRIMWRPQSSIPQEVTPLSRVIKVQLESGCVPAVGVSWGAGRVSGCVSWVAGRVYGWV